MFNPELKTSWYMVPSLIGLILAFIGTIITSIGVVREREAGTLEQLAVMPFRPANIVFGKIGPYFVLASIDMLVVVVLGMLLFGPSSHWSSSSMPRWCATAVRPWPLARSD